MNIEEDEYACLTYIDYSTPYPLDTDNVLCIEGHESQDFSPITETIHGSSIGNSYHSISNLNSILKCKGEGDLFVMHLNAVSLVAHYDEIESLISAKISATPDILCISETRFKDSKVDYQSKLATHPDYDLVYDNSPTNAGGVAIYVKHNIKFTVNRELKLKVDDCESLFIELDISDKLILGSQKTVLIGCIYRHPRPQTESFLDSLSGILDHYTQRETPILIMGDINYDVSNKDKASTKLYENMLNSFGCSNIISVSTRFGKSNNAILDHIITNYDLNKTVHGVLDFTMIDTPQLSHYLSILAL